MDQYIEPNPHRPGIAEARLRDYGVSIWAIIGHLEAVEGDLAQVATDYEIPLEVIEAAYAFYDNHRAAIDARIAANSTDYEDVAV